MRHAPGGETPLYHLLRSFVGRVGWAFSWTLGWVPMAGGGHWDRQIRCPDRRGPSWGWGSQAGVRSLPRAPHTALTVFHKVALMRVDRNSRRSPHAPLVTARPQHQTPRRRPVLSAACRSSSIEGAEWRQASHQFSHLLGAPSARPPGTRLRPLPAPSGWFVTTSRKLAVSPHLSCWLSLHFRSRSKEYFIMPCVCRTLEHSVPCTVASRPSLRDRVAAAHCRFLGTDAQE